jgi:type II secretory pathway component GspD/PulD (secretin)
LEQQLAVEDRRLTLEEKRLQIQQRQRQLEEIKRDLERRPHRDIDPKRLTARQEQEQFRAAERDRERTLKVKAHKKEREQQAKAEPVIKIFRLQRDKASDQMAIVRLIAPKVQVIFHARTNTIIVSGPEPQLQKVEALPKKLDEMETVTVDPQVQLPIPLPSD